MSRNVSCLHCDWTGPESRLSARPATAGITLDVCPACGHDTYLYLPQEHPPMTTRVRITCAHEAHHHVTIKEIAPDLQGGYRGVTADLKPGEEREFYVHAGQALVIDEGSAVAAGSSAGSL